MCVVSVRVPLDESGNKKALIIHRVLRTLHTYGREARGSGRTAYGRGPLVGSDSGLPDLFPGSVYRNL